MNDSKRTLPELPNGWVWTKLGGIINPSKEKVDPLEFQGIPYIGLEHIGKDTGKILGQGLSNEVRSTKARFYNGDLLYGKLRPYLNKVYVADFDGVCSTDILVFSRSPYISNKYLFYRFLCGDFVNYASQNVSGVQHPRVNFKTLSQFNIAFPPLPEQQRIVARIEELFTNLDAGVESLKAARTQLKRYRQSVLKSACEGRLVPTEAEMARAEGREYEPADVLLERVLEERRRKWVENNTGKKYKEPATPDTEVLPELPESWSWSTYEQIGFWSGGGTPSKRNLSYWEGGTIPWISPKDFKSSKIHDSIDKITAIGFQNSSVKLISSNSLVFVVRSGILRRILPIALISVDTTVNQDIKSLTPSAFLNADFLLQTSVAHREDIRHSCSKDGTTVESIEVPALQVYPIPLPPLAEQHRIVAEVERRLSVADEMEKTIEHSLKQAQRLRQSILKRAFEGKLVPQDPEDEPAGVLLERIRHEKEIHEKNNKLKRRKTRGNKA